MFTDSSIIIGMDCDSPPTNQDICKQFFEVMQRIKLHVSQVAELHGLTMQQIWAMYMLREHGQMVMGGLAGQLHCDASNITGIVERLVNHGLVQRQEAPEDRRQKRLALTPQGNEVIEQLLQALPKSLGLDALTEKERSCLGAALRQLS
jgi:MarR family transcriptional regulator, organic hydroperoxide resistance regulator